MGEAKRKRNARTFMIHNSDGIADETWEGDQGAFNVTRGYRLAEGPYLLDLAPIYERYGHLEVDRAYAASITFPRLNEPILIAEDDEGVMWVIDGRHRIEARHMRGMTTVLGMIVPKEKRPQIEVSFSVFEGGERVLHTRHMSEATAFMQRQAAETKGEANAESKA